MEKAVVEARVFTSLVREDRDLPKHWAPLLQTSPFIVRLPFWSIERAVLSFWFLSNRPWGVPSKGASVILQLLPKNRSPTYELVARKVPFT